MGGLEAISKIREFDQDIPIILMTVYRTEDWVSEGVTATLSKPIQMATLSSLLQSLPKQHFQKRTEEANIAPLVTLCMSAICFNIRLYARDLHKLPLDITDKMREMLAESHVDLFSLLLRTD